MSSTIDDKNDRDIISTQQEQESSSLVTNVICESNPISTKVEFADANYSDEDEQKSTEDDNHSHGGVIAFDQYDLDEFPIDSDTIDLTHCRVQTIPDLSRFIHLENLCLRENLLNSIGIVTPNLTQLDLYENQIETIDNELSTLINLVHLDLSYNRLRKIGNAFVHLVNLRVLYLVHNKITRIEGLDQLHRLELLELGDNRIRKIEGLQQLTSLRKLYLGKNKINKIENLDSLTNLIELNIPGNRLTKLDGLDQLTNITELYLSDQGICSIDGLLHLTQLTVLDVGNNRIDRLDGIDRLSMLEDFWINDNQISDWKEVDKLSQLAALRTVYLERNPIYHSDTTSYRRKIMLALSQVTQIDATECR